MTTLGFHHGVIRTMDVHVPSADVVIVRDDRILAVGGAELLDRNPEAWHVDLGGRTLLPGLIDAHNHLSVVALQPRWGDASDLGDTDALVAALRAQADVEPDAGVGPPVRVERVGAWAVPHPP